MSEQRKQTYSYEVYQADGKCVCTMCVCAGPHIPSTHDGPCLLILDEPIKGGIEVWTLQDLSSAMGIEAKP